MTRVVLLALGLAAGAVFALPAEAHESRPLYIEVSEKAPLTFLVRWKIPPSVKVRNAPEVSMTNECMATTPRPAAGAGRGNLRYRSFRCEADPAGTALRIHYPLFNPSVSTLVRISRLSGETHSLVASPDDREVIIPAVESFGSIARDYLTLGVQHILGGYDHLLFLVCLLLIAGTGRRILVTAEYRLLGRGDRARRPRQPDLPLPHRGRCVVWLASRFRLCSGARRDWSSSNGDPGRPVLFQSRRGGRTDRLRRGHHLRVPASAKRLGGTRPTCACSRPTAPAPNPCGLRCRQPRFTLDDPARRHVLDGLSPMPASMGNATRLLSVRPL
ncbi:MAG: HupE/UreJ family protein [Deltaproteobacteria bacterium]|nr:HupE/UreJ family protein [Deltaproteobacteria bacterium]